MLVAKWSFAPIVVRSSPESEELQYGRDCPLAVRHKVMLTQIWVNKNVEWLAVRPYALRASRFTRKALKDPYLTVPEEQVAMVSWTVDTSLDSLTPTAFRGGLIQFYIGISMSLYGKSNSASFSHFADQSKNLFTISWLQGWPTCNCT